MTYGVSKKALGYPLEIPPEVANNVTRIDTDQIDMERKVC
jgi:hypothetical protein